MERTVNLDTTGLISTNLFIQAAETEDELGTVLRFHLAVENQLQFFVDQHRTGEVRTYVREPRDFGSKLGFAVAFGLPLPFAAVCHQINRMRNDFAHPRGGVIQLDEGNVRQLGRLVDALTSIDPRHTPLAIRFIELPVSRPGERISYGSGSLRLDFVMAAMSFLSASSPWLLQHAVMRTLPTEQ